MVALATGWFAGRLGAFSDGRGGDLVLVVVVLDRAAAGPAGPELTPQDATLS